MGDKDFPLTAQFLRGLAATVGGRPEGPNNYFMIGTTVRGKQLLVFGANRLPLTYESRSEAEAELKRLRENEARLQEQGKGTGAVFAVLGPFLAPDDPAQPHDVLVAGVLSRRGGTRGDSFARWKVESSMDMLCFSPSAFDKFIAPYYYALYGTGLAASSEVQRLKDEMIKSASGIMGHRWPTSPTFLEAEFKVLDDGQDAGPQEEPE
jgi:hypothetical protein